VILYTPMQLELVFAGLDQMVRLPERKASINGIPVLLRRSSDGKEEIAQILSTNPADYLRVDLFPGAQVKPGCLD